MDFKSIESLIKTLSESTINYLEIEDHELKIKLSKGSFEKEGTRESISNIRPEVLVIEDKKTEIAQKLDVIQELGDVDEESFHYIKSPMVGTFYTSSSEDGEPYVKCGDKVIKGQEVCIVEAMKLMNEIESEVEGTIIEVMVNNGDIVEFGESLFKVKL